MAEPWLLTDREARQVVESTRRGSRDPVEHINKAFIKASDRVAEKMGFSRGSRAALEDIEYWDKRLSASLAHVKSLILRGQSPTKDEALALLRDCATVARALFNDFKSAGGRTTHLEPLVARIEATLKAAEKGGRAAKVHPADLYYTLEGALEANDQRRLMLLPVHDLRRAYLHASLNAVQKISGFLGSELHRGAWRAS
jgi:hypothetical protein